MDRRRTAAFHAAALLWAAAAAFLLTQNAADSARLSERLTAWILSLPVVKEIFPTDAETALRKTAHFFLYAVEGFLLAMPGSRGVALVPCGAAMAAAGELSQKLAAGRSCEAADMAIDFSGFVLGAWIAHIVTMIPRRKRGDKERDK